MNKDIDMNDISANETDSVVGGYMCEGTWLGTVDGKYGICFGHWL